MFCVVELPESCWHGAETARPKATNPIIDTTVLKTDFSMAKTEPAEIRSQPLFADFEVLLRVSVLQARVPFLAAVPPIQRHAYTVITFLTCESHECS